ncbi:MAG TPA: hypothetical protein DCP92_00355 [Nitrospiraceae bacterium]|nr:hypothetical protein [Nitrospiraceae bacterium]
MFAYDRTAGLLKRSRMEQKKEILWDFYLPSSNISRKAENRFRISCTGLPGKSDELTLPLRWK